MGTNGINALAAAEATIVDGNMSNDTATAYMTIGLVSDYFSVTEANMAKLGVDSVNDFVAKLSITGGNPEGAAKAAELDAKYNNDQQEMSVEQGKLNTIIETEKTRLSQINDSVKNGFSILTPFTSLLQLETTLIGKILV